MQTYGCRIGQPQPVTINAGESVILEALDHISVEGDTGIDFGLYGGPKSLIAENGVAMEGDDFMVPRCFTFGPEAVAHLFTRSRMIIVTCAEQDVGTINVVVQAVGRQFNRKARGEKPVV